MATIGTLVIALVSDSARFEQGMARARRQTDELEKAIRQLEKGGLDRMAAGMTASAAQTSKVSDWMRKLSGYSSATATTLTTTTRAAEGMSAGFRKAENALIDLGLGSVGLNGKVGRVAEGLLSMGVGGPVTLAVVAGLALVGLGIRSRIAEMEALGRAAGEARQRLAEAFKEREGASVSGLSRQLEIEQRRFRLLQASLQGQGPSTALMAALAESAGAIQELQARIGTLEDRNKTATEKIIYDWRRVRNVFMEEIVESAAKARMEAIRGQLERYQALFRGLGKLSPDAPSGDEIGRTVEANAARVAGRAGESTLKRIEATAIGRQQQMAKFVEAIWVSAAQNIQSATADVFQSIFNGQIKSLGDFARSVVSIVQRAIAEILAAQAASGLAPLLRGALAGGGSGIPSAPDTSWLGGANGGVPTSFSRAQATVVHVTYAPTVYAIDAQNTQRFLRQNRASLAAEVGRVVGESSMARAALGR